MLTIGIPIRNALDYARITINSVLENTRTPIDLVLVDDCSNEETRSFLSSFSNVIRNESVMGFPHNCNLILKAAKGDNICILNSDLYCTYGWERKLLSALDTFDIVGPSSGRVCGKQQIKEVEAFQKLWTREDVGIFSIMVSNKYQNETEELKTLGGFCFMLKRAVVDKVGFFDERYGLGSYEETDYFHRARLNGFRCGWVKGCYIHHFGHVSFCDVDEAEDLWRTNRNLFKKIHNLTDWDVLDLHK